jgi:type VI secretion system secreted protein VgrG
MATLDRPIGQQRAQPPSRGAMTPHKGGIDLQITGCGVELRVRSFVGHDSLSELFSYELELSAQSAVPSDDVIGKAAQLTVGTTELHGLLMSWQLAGKDGDRLLYHGVLAPAAWRMAQGRNCRIFQSKTVKEIATILLDEWGINDYRFALDPKLPLEPRIYCVQYHESDWAFITRLFEESGIYYFFGHAEGKHELVMTSGSFQHEMVDVIIDDEGNTRRGKLSYRPSTRQNISEEHISQLTARQQMKPDVYVVREQQIEKPWLLDKYDSQVSGKSGKPIEVYDYIGEPKGRGPSKLPQTRLEELRAALLWLEGASSCAGLRAGLAFQLEDYVDEDLNEEMLIVRTDHYAVMPQEESSAGATFNYGNTFSCVPRRVPYRAARATPRPLIYGIQTALVVGPSGEEIDTDVLGRVKVQFPWDRYGQNDQRSSAWVPVAQMSAGPAWGSLIIPRIGQQVIVQFIDGDPDQPLITGQVYHRGNAPPASLPGDKTQTAIKSYSSPKTGGHNEIRLEDRKGAEKMLIRAELDRTTLVQHDDSTTINHDSTTTIHHDETRTVDNNFTETIHANYTQTVDANQTITVHGSLTETVDGNTGYTVGGNQTETIGGSRMSAVSGSHVDSVGGARSTSVGGTLTTSIGAASTTTIGGSAIETIAGAKVETIGGTLALKVGGAVSIAGSGLVGVSAGGVLTLKAPSIVLSGTTVSIEGGDVTIKSSGTVTIQGAAIKHNC